MSIFEFVSHAYVLLIIPVMWWFTGALFQALDKPDDDIMIPEPSQPWNSIKPITTDMGYRKGVR